MPETVKEWTKRRGQSLADDLDILLGDLCVIWGFCNGLTGWELTHQGGTITPESFARAVVSAEGLDTASSDAWLPKLRGVFADRYGDAASETNFKSLQK